MKKAAATWTTPVSSACLSERSRRRKPVASAPVAAAACSFRRKAVECGGKGTPQLERGLKITRLRK